MTTTKTNKALQTKVKDLEIALEASREIAQIHEKTINQLRYQISNLEEIKLIHSKYLSLLLNSSPPLSNTPFGHY